MFKGDERKRGNRGGHCSGTLVRSVADISLLNKCKEWETGKEKVLALSHRLVSYRTETDFLTFIS